MAFRAPVPWQKITGSLTAVLFDHVFGKHALGLEIARRHLDRP
jgi:hypothetical protein